MKKLSMGMMVVAVVAIMVVISVPPTLAEGDDSIDKLPSCVAKIYNCTVNTDYSDMIGSGGEIKNPCCPIWADQAENERDCFCKYYVESEMPDSYTTTAFNMTENLEVIFKSCKIDLDPSTMCKDNDDSVDHEVGNASGNANGASKIALVGFIPSIVALIWTIILAI